MYDVICDVIDLYHKIKTAIIFLNTFNFLLELLKWLFYKICVWRREILLKLTIYTCLYRILLNHVFCQNINTLGSFGTWTCNIKKIFGFIDVHNIFGNESNKDNKSLTILSWHDVLHACRSRTTSPWCYNIVSVYNLPFINHGINFQHHFMCSKTRRITFLHLCQQLFQQLQLQLQQRQHTSKHSVNEAIF